MAPIFASPDIAALVPAFPPPSPTKDQPSLVRSNSGNKLVDSRQVLARFRTLLETASERIRLADLPSRLGVGGKADWVLECYEGLVHYGRDGQSLLPEAEVEWIMKDVTERVRSEVINVGAYAASRGISDQTLRGIIARAERSGWRWWYDGGDPEKDYSYSEEFTRRVGEYVQSLDAEQLAEGVDLTQRYDGVPAGLLVAFAKIATRNGGPLAGKEEVSNGRAVFTATCSGAEAGNKQQAARRAQIEQCVHEVRGQGFCRIASNSATSSDNVDGNEHNAMIEDVRNRFAELSPNDGGSTDLVQIPIEDGKNTTGFILAPQRRLDEALENLCFAARQEAAKTWHARESADTPSTIQTSSLTSLESQSEKELSRVLLQTVHSAHVEEIVSSKIEELQTQDNGRFRHLLTERLLAPVALYAAGVATIKDETLRQHLEEYLGEHFRRETVPALSANLQEQRLLLDQPRRRDYDKFQQASADARAVSGIQSALSKLARKQKIDQPSAQAMQEAKQQTLQSKAKAIRKMPRGSDVLQNCIWILLACATDGLYMSSGKDTTRMIKQYQAVGDVEVARKLEGWRDALKAGKEDMLQEMREMADSAVASHGL